MIHITEYRVGNYVSVDNVIRPICLINNDAGFEDAPSVGIGKDLDCTYEHCSASHLSAVPLTDNLLLELGFHFHNEEKRWQYPHLEGTYAIELSPDHVPLDSGYNPIKQKLGYVHQLQNLFYVIQGRELTLGGA